MADGLSRRDMIKGAAVAGAAAWTAPMIIDSLTSPAAAASGGLPTTCSYALIVFTYNGAGPYIMKIAQGSASCTFDDSTSNDTSFSNSVCGSYTYAGGKDFGKEVVYKLNGAPSYGNFAAYPGGQTCSPGLFTVSNTTITTNDANVQIIFAVSHYGAAFHPTCPGSGTSVTVQCG